MLNLVYDWLRRLAVKLFTSILCFFLRLLLRMSDFEGSVDNFPNRAHGSKKDSRMCALQPENLYLVTDFTRPRPVKEDLVVYKKNEGFGLAYVYKAKSPAVEPEERMFPDLSGSICRLELVPACKRVLRAIEEVLVIDRSFNVGETVIPFENEFLGQKKEEELWVNMDKQMGLVTECKMFADILALPDKQFVLKDVPIDKEPEFVEIFGYHLSHNYIMYEQWIGDVRECTHLLTCNYKNHKVVIREAGDKHAGVFLKRVSSDETKAFVPGEKIYMTYADANSKFVQWPDGIPNALSSKGKPKNFKRRMADVALKMVVEKVETYEMHVEWITSPSDPLNQPPRTIKQEDIHKVAHLDTFVNPRVSSTDRIFVYPKDGDTFITKTEYMDEIAEKYAGSFRKWILPNAHKREGPSPKMAKSDEGDVDMEKGESEGEEGPSNEMEVDSSESEEEEEKEVVQKRKRKKARRTAKPSPPIPTERNARALFGDKFYGEVLSTRSLISVKWMDGTEQKDIPSYSLVPVDPDLDQQDHLPGTVISRKGEAYSDLTFGIILKTNTTERSCWVRWFKRQSPETPLEFDKDEEVTLFDVMLHGVYKRCYMGYHGVELDKDTTELRQISYQVVADLDNGKQRVKYLDGRTAELWPDEITALQFEDSMEESESSDDEGGWEPQPDEVNNAQAPGDVVTRSGRVRDSDAPKEFCHRMMHMLNDATEESLFRAMGMMVVAYPFSWDNARRVELAGGEEERYPDVNGHCWEADGKHIWNCTHPMVECAAEYLTLVRMVGMEYTHTDSDKTPTFTKEQEQKHPLNVARMRALAQEYPQLPLMCGAFHPKHPAFCDTLVRMANMAFFGVQNNTNFYPSSRLLFVIGFADNCVSVRRFLQAADPNMHIEEVIHTVTRRNHRNFSDLIVGVANVCCPENARKACHALNGSYWQGNQIHVLALQEWTYFMNLVLFSVTSYDGKGRWLNDEKENWFSWSYGEGHKFNLDEIKLKFVDTSIRSICLGEQEFSSTNSFSQTIKELLEQRPSEEVSSIRLVLSPGEIPSPFEILGQLISGSTFPVTIYTDKSKMALDREDMVFVEALLWLWGEGVLSGPYVCFGEVLRTYLKSFVQRRITVASKIMTLEVQQECLSILTDAQYFPLWQRLNRLTSNGMSLSHVYQSIRACMEGDMAGNTTIIPLSQLTRRAKCARTLTLKTELENWCTFLGVAPKEAEEQDVKAETKEVEGVAKFEVLDVHSPHHSFAKRSCASGRKFFQAVQKEHKTLSLHLPDGIYVRAFDDRLDLLSVVIVGPCGTPFEGVPFIFDIFIPETYPQVPPEVYYVAYSQEQLNPNLYQQGKVCTSLLGTWSGEGQENWNPSSSNILQVLISIQGLILVPEPYFNEAGYEARKADPATKICSQRYNETATVNALDYLYTVMGNPPSDRKDIVQKQIFRIWPQLREVFQSWCQEAAEPQFPVVNSKGFRMALAKAGEKIDGLVERLRKRAEEEPKEEKTTKKMDMDETEEGLSRTFILLAKEEDRCE